MEQNYKSLRGFTFLCPRSDSWLCTRRQWPKARFRCMLYLILVVMYLLLTTLLGIYYLSLNHQEMQMPQWNSLSMMSTRSLRSSLKSDLNTHRADTVKEMMLLAWRQYVVHCGKHGDNELAPLTMSCSRESDRLVGPKQLLTAIEALDTLALMGLDKEFEEARQLVHQLHKPHSCNGTVVNVYETTSKMIGGLLGAYSLTGDTMFVSKAAEVGDGLAAAFDRELAHPSVKSFRTEASGEDDILLAEIGGLYLEFSYLSLATGVEKYHMWASRNQENLMKQIPNRDFVYTNSYSYKCQESSANLYSIDGTSDVFYEYLLKRCLFEAEDSGVCRTTYKKSLDSIMRNMGKIIGRTYKCVPAASSKAGCAMQHRTCSLGGLFALAYLQNRERTDWLQFALDVAETCYISYALSPSGVGPDEFDMDQTHDILVPTKNKYSLRAEMVESLYYIYVATREPAYMDWAWNILVAINESSRSNLGFSGFQHTKSNPKLDNVQKSYFLGETLKYLYLMFSPLDHLPIDQWLLSSAGHVLPTNRNWINSILRENLRLSGHNSATSVAVPKPMLGGAFCLLAFCLKHSTRQLDF